MARTDIHRPSEFVPADYEFQFHYSHDTMIWTEDGGDVLEGFNLDMLEGMVREAPSEFFRTPSPDGCDSKCDVCGTRYLHGSVWLHTPSQEHVLLGHNCADKYATLIDRTTWAAWKSARDKRVSQALKDKKYAKTKALQCAVAAAQMEELHTAHPDLREALAYDHYIINDIRGRTDRWAPSEAQTALVLKIWREERDKVLEIPAEVPITDKRVQVEGVIAGLKEVETDYGWTTKMLLKVTTPEGGVYKLWGSVATALDEAEYNLRQERLGALDGVPETLENQGAFEHARSTSIRGATVRFMARIERSRKDTDFGFFSRPTKATVVKWAEE